MDSSIRFVFFLLVFKAVNISQAFTPLPRFGHNTHLINNKIYYFGGKDLNGNFSRDFFYLNLPLTPTPQYLYASNSSKLPEFSLLNYTGDFEGQGTKGDFKNTVYKIRIDSNPIIIEQLDNTAAPSPRERLIPVTDMQGKIYFFGGWDGVGNDNTMYILDSNNAKWTMVKSNNAPDMIWNYAPILTDDGRILYISGNHLHEKKYAYMPFNSIPVFNINTNDWERIDTIINVPVGRAAHAAILAADKKRVIVYGGEINHTDYS
ncbi:4750_t:CDS:2 [Ambispora gerdemannii]|uniref:4750_t:CDS:1 n=1 Tax=Ambispora gerdemannii TaxID=144530 RepID=A0A9N9AQA1_9GLOM|nr:4750_t:CDS:2 [Ambispora gerdemannii]